MCQTDSDFEPDHDEFNFLLVNNPLHQPQRSSDSTVPNNLFDSIDISEKDNDSKKIDKIVSLFKRIAKI